MIIDRACELVYDLADPAAADLEGRIDNVVEAISPYVDGELPLDLPEDEFLSVVRVIALAMIRQHDFERGIRPAADTKGHPDRLN
jgi:hypothetical protein